MSEDTIKIPPAGPAHSFTFRGPRLNGWRMYLHGYGTNYATVFSLMDSAKPPCWFHRVMVRLILGIVWVKEEV